MATVIVAGLPAPLNAANPLVPTPLAIVTGAGLSWGIKDPAEREFYTLPMAAIGMAGDAVQTCTVQVPGGLRLLGDPVLDGDQVGLWIDSGVAETDYEIGLVLLLASETIRHVQVALSVRALAPAGLPADTSPSIRPPLVLSVDDAPLTFGQIPLTFGA